MLFYLHLGDHYNKLSFYPHKNPTINNKVRVFAPPPEGSRGKLPHPIFNLNSGDHYNQLSFYPHKNPSINKKVRVSDPPPWGGAG